MYALAAVTGTPSHSYGMSLSMIMGSHSVTCHLTQVNTLRIYSSQSGRPVLDLPAPPGWKAELTPSKV